MAITRIPKQAKTLAASPARSIKTGSQTEYRGRYTGSAIKHVSLIDRHDQEDQEDQQYNPSEIIPELTIICTSRSVITQWSLVLLYRVFHSSVLLISTHLSCYTPYEDLTFTIYIILFFCFLFSGQNLVSRLQRYKTNKNKQINNFDICVTVCH